MKIDEVRQKAEKVGLAPRKMKKIELIWAIQKAEGNFSCFGKNYGGCPSTGCCWLDDCYVLYKKRVATQVNWL